jgi:hypothetical protein
MGCLPCQEGTSGRIENEGVLTDGAALPQFDPPPESGADAPAEFRVSFPGPFVHHDVVVDGWRVPYLHAQLVGEDRVLLVLDRRLGVELSTEEADRVVPFLADSIAVALGYGAHPRREDQAPLARAPYPRPERVVEVVLDSPEV